LWGTKVVPLGGEKELARGAWQNDTVQKQAKGGQETAAEGARAQHLLSGGKDDENTTSIALPEPIEQRAKPAQNAAIDISKKVHEKKPPSRPPD